MLKNIFFHFVLFSPLDLPIELHFGSPKAATSPETDNRVGFGTKLLFLRNSSVFQSPIASSVNKENDTRDKRV